MRVVISFKHLEHTESLDELIRNKSEKLIKHFNGESTLKWTCYVKEGHHHADVHLTGPHFDYRASAQSEIMYKSIDKALTKIDKQLLKKKNQWKNKIHNQASVEILDPEQAWSDHDEDEFDDVSKAS